MNSLSSHCDVEASLAQGLWRLRLGAWLSVVMLAGCAAVAPRSAEDQVRARAQARWEQLLKGDFRGAYQYFSPGSRLGYSEDEFQASVRRGFWKSAAVDTVTCRSAESCEVVVAVEYEFKGIRNKSPVKEAWVREGGEWWFLRQ